MKKTLASTVLAAGVLLGGDARADEWYGYQTLISDAATVAVTYALAKSITRTTVPSIAVGATGYVVAPVTIHLVHGEPVRALASGGLRVGAPLVGGIVGGLITSKESDHGLLSGLVGVWIGAAIGLVSASVIDAAAIAYETKEDAPPPATAQPLEISIGGSF